MKKREDLINCIINAMTDQKNMADTGLRLVSLIISDATLFGEVHSVVQKSDLEEKHTPLTSLSSFFGKHYSKTEHLPFKRRQDKTLFTLGPLHNGIGGIHT